MGDWKWEQKEKERQKRQQSIVQKLRAENSVVSASAIEQHLSVSERRGASAVFNHPDAVLLDAFKNLAEEIMSEALVHTLPPPIMYSSAFPLMPSPWFGLDRSAPPPEPPPLPEETVVAAIEGFRCWHVPMFRDEIRSMNGGAPWPAYQRMEADCPNGACSGIDCGCGIHAFKKLKSAHEEYPVNSRYPNRVFGSVWLWGRVLECSKGYRAQFAYPKEFSDTGTLARKMAEVYGVNLIKADSLR